MGNATLTGAGWLVDEISGGVVQLSADGTSLVSGDGNSMVFNYSLEVEAPLRASFPLKSTLVADTYQGSDSVVTYARTGPTTVRDHLGYLQYCRDNEAPFCGARRVANLATDSESFVTGWSLGANCALSAVTNGWKVTRSSGTAQMLTLNSAAYEPGQHTASARLWVSSGSATVRMRIERSSDSATVVERDFAVTTARVRFAGFGPITDASNHRVTFNIVSGAPVEFNIAEFQMERTEGAAGAPGEYVSRGVAGGTYPYHGAGVDGVKYFTTINPCYLEASDGLVLTDETPGGVAISEDVMKGIQRSQSVTQRLLYSSDFSNAAWSKTGIGTPVAQTTMKNPVGYGRVYSLPETATTGAFTASNSWSGTVPTDNTNIAASFFLKAGLGRNWARVGIVDKAGISHRIWVDLLTGTLGTISSTLTDKEVVIEQFPHGFWRVGFSVNAASGGTVPSCFVGLADQDGSSSYAGVVGNCIYVAAAQMEASDHPSAYIAHTTSFVTSRTEATLEVPITNNLPSNDFTISLDFTPQYTTDSTKKSEFYYIAYSKFDETNRWGTALRPGKFGGNSVDMAAAGWAQDYYPNAVGFGGVNLTSGMVKSVGQTVHQIFGQASTAQQPNGDGSFMSVDGVVAWSTTTSTPTTAAIANKQTYMRLGSRNIGGQHNACYKNLKFYGRVFTANELAHSR